MRSRNHKVTWWGLDVHISIWTPNSWRLALIKRLMWFRSGSFGIGSGNIKKTEISGCSWFQTVRERKFWRADKCSFESTACVLDWYGASFVSKSQKRSDGLSVLATKTTVSLQTKHVLRLWCHFVRLFPSNGCFCSILLVNVLCSKLQFNAV